MAEVSFDNALALNRLKRKHREVREDHPAEHSLRIHCALSWLARAEQEADDDDAAFLFYWIAFNAAYAREPSPSLRCPKMSDGQQYSRT